jgi:CRP-like cAMP-binding protein
VIDTNALQKYSLFGGVLPEQIEKMKPFFEYYQYEAGDTPVIEGAPNDKIFFITSGRVEISKRGIPIAEIGEGETFGEMELIDVMPSIATVTALEPLEVVTISNAALYKISKTEPKAFALMIMNLARDLSRRLRRMDELASQER